jgi:lysophospholipase L1-like esterase
MEESADGVRGCGLRVVVAGDSITAGANWEAMLPGVQTENVAVPGFTTTDLRSQLPGITALAPDVLALLIGTNDLGGLDRNPDDIADDITTIIEILMQALPGTRIVLNSIMPRDPYWTPSTPGRLSRHRTARAWTRSTCWTTDSTCTSTTSATKPGSVFSNLRYRPRHAPNI